MTKSYMEVELEVKPFLAQGCGVVPWPVRIAEARKRGEFTDEDQDAAGDWVTCACGQQDAEIPRNNIGCPLDKELDDLGMQFYTWVSSNNFDEAEHTLAMIQKRAAIVIKQSRGES